MANAVVAVFDEYNEAQSTVNELLVAGFKKDEVRLSAEDEQQKAQASAIPDQERREKPREGGIKGFFQNLFGLEEKSEDIRIYDEAVRHGNYVVTAIAETEEKSELASEVMSHHHPVDIDERSSEWLGSSARQSESFQSGQSSQDFEQSAQPQTQGTITESATIPVIEEEVRVGKREVQRGGVRIFQRISEVPIRENVTLREEQIVVERIPVNKPATQADMGAFQEGTAELRETAEEAVVSRTARVVEEVHVGRQVNERVETVNETARRTDVDVERTGADQYRSHWQQNYGSQGGQYEDYGPAYEYGTTSASDQQYQGRSWDQVEPELRTNWESKYPGSTWERFKDSIKHAFSGRK